jgi:hypothetical protein
MDWERFPMVTKKRSKSRKSKLTKKQKTHLTRIHKRTQKKKETFITALVDCLGIITRACEKSGIDRRTVYDWIADDPQFKVDVDGVSEVALDFAEGHLHEQIRGNIPSSTIFYLKTKGQRRGFIEKQQVEHSGGVEISTVSRMSDEELNAVVEAARELEGGD